MGKRGRQEAAILAALLVVLFFTWSWPVVYPLKVLVVLFHEISHGLAALATGGTIVRIELFPQQGGLCVTRGGNGFAILNAGYLGSLAWGMALLLLSARGDKTSQGVLALLGAGIIGCALAWVRPVTGFGFGFTAAAGVACIAMARYLPDWGCAFIVRLVALSSCIYAVLDIKSDILDQPGLPSDAVLLAEYTGIPAMLWGGLWICVAVAGTALALWWSVRHAARRPT